MALEPLSREEQAIAAVRWIMHWCSTPVKRARIPGVDKFLFTTTKYEERLYHITENKDRSRPCLVDVSLGVYDIARSRKLKPVRLMFSSDSSTIKADSGSLPAIAALKYLNVVGLDCSANVGTGSVSGDVAAVLTMLSKLVVCNAQKLDPDYIRELRSQYRNRTEHNIQEQRIDFQNTTEHNTHVG